MLSRAGVSSRGAGGRLVDCRRWSPSDRRSWLVAVCRRDVGGLACSWRAPRHGRPLAASRRRQPRRPLPSRPASLSTADVHRRPVRRPSSDLDDAPSVGERGRARACRLPGGRAATGRIVASDAFILSTEPFTTTVRAGGATRSSVLSADRRPGASAAMSRRRWSACAEATRCRGSWRSSPARTRRPSGPGRSSATASTPGRGVHEPRGRRARGSASRRSMRSATRCPGGDVPDARTPADLSVDLLSTPATIANVVGLPVGLRRRRLLVLVRAVTPAASRSCWSPTSGSSTPVDLRTRQAVRPAGMPDRAHRYTPPMDRRSALVLLAVFGAGVFLAGLELMITAVALPSILADLVAANGSSAWTELRKAAGSSTATCSSTS